MPSLARVARVALDLLAPRSCAVCDAGVRGDAAFCASCAAEAGPALSLRLDGTLSLLACGPYRGPLSRAVHALKYRDRPDLAAPLGDLVARALGAAGVPAGTVLVPVPLHAARLSVRGYNQSALVAGAAARVLGLRMDASLVRRARPTQEQARLSKDERRENVAGVFTARAARPGGARDVVLVDDVVTTGSTVLACAAALTGAGHRVIGVAAIARAGDAIVLVNAAESPDAAAG